MFRPAPGELSGKASPRTMQTERVFLLLPILPDKVEAWRRLCQEVAGTRRKQYEASRERLGVVHERVSLLRSFRADVAVLCIEALDPEQTFADMLCSKDPFDLWFKRQLLDVHGLDLSAANGEPEQETLLNWTASSTKD